MSLKKQIDEDLKVAMRAQIKDEIRALRGIKSMILLAETEKGATGELSEDAEIKLLSKAAKQRRDSARLYEDQGREDLADVERSELEIISKYLPVQLSEEDLVDQLSQIISQVGAVGLQDMGKVMGAANKALKGKADGSSIAKVVKTLLNK
ncbi:MAG: GatB/YqeY domain-containing protein [Bacteroidetes bacterium]|nr:MAG: GatB/YqeY domain-containing protein [Bacteroidota bacterium]